MQHPPPRHPAYTIRLHRPSHSPSPSKSPFRLPVQGPVQGPRPLATASNRLLKCSPRDSLSRRSGSPAKADLLRRSMLELRRMNCEVSSFHSGISRDRGRREKEGGRRQYLSLDDDKGRWRGKQNWGVKGTRDGNFTTIEMRGNGS